MTSIQDLSFQIIATFCHREASSEERRRVSLLVGLSAIGILFLLLFGFTAYIQNNMPLFWLDCITGLILILNLVHLLSRKNYQFNVNFGILFVSILYVYLYTTGGTNGTAFPWYYTYPLIAVYLLGSKRGGIASALMLVPVFMVMAKASDGGFFMNYDLNFEFRFVAAYIVVAFIAYLFEATGEKNRSELQTINRSLESIIDARTQELIEKNRQLHRAQKMEAIGTLAGGVAHDLNNVLSGIVSYPELLLLEIDEESPLRDPIHTIQKSGEKASEIVQDLLTLARRGVATTEVVNLNTIVFEYLHAPEHIKLASENPDVRVSVHLNEDLFNLRGSPIHLRKTIMNLVSNAIEAQPSGGEIDISTDNRFLDAPVVDNKAFQPGEYVELRIADRGMGIAQEDIHRIFEPFYTKKKMGRSGTGLGMAVVWGTVEDHKGYIRVESQPGEGTTFFLYLPATADALIVPKAGAPIEDYLGDGQTLLVVDDVHEQRVIASKVLRKLNYEVVTVDSGEAAVAHLGQHSADLVVLDMIMAPGMDGLDTFQKILEIHPHQKVVLASGFSESERVKQAQQLGASAYVRKPYSIENIGMAVKNAFTLP